MSMRKTLTISLPIFERWQKTSTRLHARLPLQERTVPNICPKRSKRESDQKRRNYDFLTVMASAASFPSPLRSSRRGARSTRASFPLHLLFQRRDQHDRASGNTDHTFRGAAQQSPVEHSLSMDIHDEQIDFLVFEDPRNNAVRNADFDLRTDVTPRPCFWRNKSFELLLHAFDQ